MVYMAGKYKLEKSDNLAEYLKALGSPDEFVQKNEQLGLTVHVAVDGNKYSFDSDSGFSLSFILNEEFDEPLPIGITLKSTAKKEGDKVIISSKAEDGRDGLRIYEFTDNGFALELSHNNVVAKRYYTKV